MTKKMTLILAALLAAALFLAVPARPGTVPASIVPEGAGWIAHLDMEKFVATSLFQALEKSGRLDIKDREVENWLKIDVRKDISSVTVFGLGTGDKQAVVAVSGKFDKPALLAKIAAIEGHEEIAYGAYTLYSMDGDGYGAFVNDGLIILSENRAALEKVLDTAAGKAKSFAATDLSAAFKGLAPGAFLSGVVKDLTGLGKEINQSKLVGKAGGLTFTAAEKQDLLQVRVQVDAESPESAKNMADIVQGLVALARMGDKGDEVHGFVGLVDGLQVKLEGAKLRLEFDGSTEEIVKLMSHGRGLEKLLD